MTVDQVRQNGIDCFLKGYLVVAPSLILPELEVRLIVQDKLDGFFDNFPSLF